MGLFAIAFANGQCLSNIGSGYNHVIALKPNGTVWSWGNGSYGWGAIGTGSNFQDALTPTQISSATTWASTFVGANNTFAIRTDGTLWATGGNENGELGNGTSGLGNVSTSLIPIGSATNWKTIAANDYFTVAIKTNGTLWTWGRNDYGELGDGTYNAHITPTQVGTATNWKVITTGHQFALALKTDGTLWAWGSNSGGTLGLGTSSIITRNVPTQVGTDNDWKAVQSGPGAAHVLALKTTGKLYVFGSDWSSGDGSCGMGLNAPPFYTPTQLGTDTDWAFVGCGFNNSFAIKTNGTLWACGQNDKGQLGDGTTADKGYLVQIGTDSNWAAVGSGYDHTVALKTDGSVWSWGDGSIGQQGNGGYTSSLVPVPVAVPGCVLATEIFQQEAISAYPNPVKGLLHVEGISGDYMVYDVRGSAIKSGTLSHGNTIDFSGVAGGVYILKIGDQVLKVMVRN